MKLNDGKRVQRRRIKFAGSIFGMTLAFALAGTSASAQTAPTDVKSNSDSFQTFYLNNVSDAHDVNEVVAGLRNLLDPIDKVYLLPSQNAILVRATPDQLVLAQKLLKDIDRAKKSYRLTYTFTETDDGKRIATQHFAIIVVSGGRTVLKNGSKVPIVTANPTSNATQNAEVTYIDIGLNIDASLDESINGMRLRTKVDRSSVAEERSGVGSADPVIRQTSLEGTSILTQGKQVMLGSLDIPSSTRHLDVEVVLEPAP
jgi:type II secretory pathway component GspD/PulD (secretin)